MTGSCQAALTCAFMLAGTPRRLPVPAGEDVRFCELMHRKLFPELRKVFFVGQEIVVKYKFGNI